MRRTDPKKPESALTTWGDVVEPAPPLDAASEQLSRLWADQINGQIRYESKFLTGPMAAALVDISARGASIPARFVELFSHPEPPIEMLEYTKRLAKAVRHRPDSPADKIATALYYLAIAAALVRHRRRITELDDPSLAFGLNWVLDQPWIDPATRRLFVEALSYLKSHPSEPAS